MSDGNGNNPPNPWQQGGGTPPPPPPAPGSPAYGQQPPAPGQPGQPWNGQNNPGQPGQGGYPPPPQPGAAQPGPPQPAWPSGNTPSAPPPPSQPGGMGGPPHPFTPDYSRPTGGHTVIDAVNVFSQTWGIFKANWKKLIGIIIVPLLAGGFLFLVGYLALIGSTTATNPKALGTADDQAAKALIFAVVAMIGALIMAFGQALALAATRKFFSPASNVSFGASLLAIMATTFLVSLVVAMSSALIITFPVAIWLALKWYIAPAVAAHEGTVIGAMKTSWRLSQGNMLQFVLVYFITVAMSMAIFFTCGLGTPVFVAMYVLMLAGAYRQAKGDLPITR